MKRLLVTLVLLTTIHAPAMASDIKSVLLQYDNESFANNLKSMLRSNERRSGSEIFMQRYRLLSHFRQKGCDESKQNWFVPHVRKLDYAYKQYLTLLPENLHAEFNREFALSDSTRSSFGCSFHIDYLTQDNVIVKSNQFVSNTTLLNFFIEKSNMTKRFLVERRYKFPEKYGFTLIELVLNGPQQMKNYKTQKCTANVDPVALQTMYDAIDVLRSELPLKHSQTYDDAVDHQISPNTVCEYIEDELWGMGLIK